MPPKVVDQVVAPGKVLLVAFEQTDAFVLPALHLHHVSDRVYPPEVSRVDLQRGPSERLRRSIVAALLVGEATTGQDGAVPRHVVTPFRKDLLDGGLHGFASA